MTVLTGKRKRLSTSNSLKPPKGKSFSDNMYESKITKRLTSVLLYEIGTS